MIKLTAKYYDDTVASSIRIWPKYATQLMNIASQNCKATSPKNIGSIKDAWLQMRQNRIRGTLNNWINFYNETYGEQNLIDAGQKIHIMLNKMGITWINKDMCIDYAKEVVYHKTHIGLGGEEIAIQVVAKFYNKKYKFSTSKEEVLGIDGWIGNKPVQVKRHDSNFKAHVHNHADKNKTLIITYQEKRKICYIHNPDFMNE